MCKGLMPNMDIKNMSRYLPTYSDLMRGIPLVILGSLFMNGGGIGLKATEDAEWIPVMLPKLDAWICYLVMWLGIDTFVFKAKATTFVMDKTLVPILRLVIVSIVGEDRVVKITSKLRSFDDKIKGSFTDD